MSLTRKERSERRRRAHDYLEQYRASHSTEEVRRHVRARYPSGRPSHGGANRSSNLRREIRKYTLTVELCLVCGGVTPDVMQLTQLFPACACGTFRVT
jgi:hypothetical protein